MLHTRSQQLIYQWLPSFTSRTTFRIAVMFPNISFYLFCLRAAFALQIPRRTAITYTNTSSSSHPPTSTLSDPFCCELYAPNVGLYRWYSGDDPKVLDEVVVTEFLRYNSTFLQIAIPRVTDPGIITFEEHVVWSY
jgi:hypothetical protein